jgi:ribosomal protein S6
MTNEDKDKKTYELALLLKGEEDVASAMTLVREHKGELVSEPRTKKLALAYKIKGYTEAVFTYVTFQTFPEDAKNLEHDLLTRAGVIRSMIIATPPPAEKATGTPTFTSTYRGRTSAPRSAPATEPRPTTSRSQGPLSNEALEKKIEEISQ